MATFTKDQIKKLMEKHNGKKIAIRLDDSLLIGKGRDRLCFKHPYNNTLCVKVAIQPEKQSRREEKYFSYLSKTSKDLSLLCPIIGTVQTNLGKGYVFPLAINSKGEIAKTLAQNIIDNNITHKDFESIFDDIQFYLLEQSICIFDLSPHNIAIFEEKPNQWKFRIIDGIGGFDPNPLRKRIPYLCELHLKREIASFRKRTCKIFQKKIQNQTST